MHNIGCRRVLLGFVAVFLLIGAATSAGALQPPGPPVDRGQRSNYALTGTTVTSVLPGTRVLLANGEPFLVKGYNHWPNALGEGTAIVDPYFDTSQCARDGRLLRGAGATAVRIWLDFGRALGVPPQLRECAELFAAEGIGIAWTIPQPGGNPADPGFKETFELYIDLAVEALADSPATLFWLIGNEIELLQGCRDSHDCLRTWFGTPGGERGVLDELSERVQALDPNHLVGTSVSGHHCFMLAFGTNVPSLDVWGLNTYPWGGAPLSALCGGTFFDRIDADPRPKIITEFGTDRFWCVPALETGNGFIQSCEPDGSGEDQAAQAAWLANIWDSMGELATPSDPMGSMSGGVAFFFADIWEHCLVFLGCLVGTPMTHEVAAVRHGGAPDGSLSFEWWGIVHAQLRGSTTPRVTTLGFDALARRWSETAPPEMTEAPIVDLSDGSCAPAVTWKTSQFGTSELQLAIDGRKIDAEGLLISDDTIYQQVAHDMTEKRTHRVSLPSLLPGVTYRIVPRTFTPDARSVTAEPLIYTHPSECGLGSLAGLIH